MAAADALEDARRHDLPSARIADAINLERAMLETLLRSLISADRRSEVDRQRLRAETWEILDAETQRIWRRLDQLAEILRRTHEVPEVTDDLDELSANDFGGAG